MISTATPIGPFTPCVLPGWVYVLHAVQKKATKGSATPKHEIELIKSRLRDAEMHYRARLEKGRHKS